MKFLKAKSATKIILALFIITNLVYLSMVMITIPKTMAFSGGMRLLDMMPIGYDKDYVNQLFYSLGKRGRDVNLSPQIPLDMVYPLLFGVTYFLVLANFLKRLGLLKIPFFYLCGLPIIAALADYLENFWVIKMLYDYPNLQEGTVTIANSFTIIKSLTTSIYFIGLIIVLLKLTIKSIRKRQLNKEHLRS